MKLGQSLVGPCAAIFRVDSAGDEFQNWNLEPISTSTLRESDGFFLVRGCIIRDVIETESCFIDLCMPERVSSYVYVVAETGVTRSYHYELNGAEVVSAVAVESFGDYELFYSRKQPNVGINVLRKGLAAAVNKAAIANDLGYLLRDENRFNESIEAFSITIQAGPPSEFTLIERAKLLDAVGKRTEAEADWKTLEGILGKEAADSWRQ